MASRIIRQSAFAAAYEKALADKAAKEAKAALVKARKPKAAPRKAKPAAKPVPPKGSPIECYDGFSTTSPEEWFAHMRDTHPTHG